MLTLDLIQEEDALPEGDGKNFRVDLEKSLSHLSPDCPRSKTDGILSARTTEVSGKSKSLPRETAGPAQVPQPGKPFSPVEKNRCASMDEILSHSDGKAAKNKTTTSHSTGPTGTTVPISQLQELINQKLEKTERLLTKVQGEREKVKGKDSAEAARTEAEKLLKEAAAAWGQAREVLEEVKELRALYRQLDSSSPISPSNSTKLNPNRKSLM
uniref:Pleckstrin homology domain containing, family O member 1b n=2 Tax=Mastacembelus armatus TaxID=205130 RepID=A0A7N8YS04_9TELE